MSWKAEYAVLIMISTIIDYFAALHMSRTKKKTTRKGLLLLSLCVNLGLLFAFKYFNFFSESARVFLQSFGMQFSPLMLNVLLPVGISFYTFQTLGYTIDVYNKKIKPEKHFGVFAVYVSFFPQLVAGPIERAKNLMPQFYKKHKFNYMRITNGLKLMLWGFFKKVVIADRLALVVNTVYADPYGYSGIPLIVATVFFAFQIYCDFSGYSDIAIGAAQVMGYNLMDNFKRPYFAKTISEFWKRWHISLSTWFRDYLYIPLGGNRVKVPRWYFNLFITFVISGLWHGANWTFLAWGAIHGIYLIISIITKKWRAYLHSITGLTKIPWMHNMLKRAIIFALVCIGWIFFRADTIAEGWYVLTHLFSGLTLDFTGLNIGLGWEGLIIAFASIIFLEFVHTIQEHRSIRQMLVTKPLCLDGWYTMC